MDDHPEDRVEIRQVETLSENRKALRNYTLAYTRRDGSRQTLKREVYFPGPSAAVLPIDPRRSTVLLTRQFRLPVELNGDRPWLVEACAGNVDPGDDPAETVRKEAEQEMGYRLRAVRPVVAVYVSPGTTTEKLHLFTAEYAPDDRCGQGGGLPEEGEEIEILEMPLTRAWEMVEAGEIVDGKTVLLLQHALLRAGGAGGARPQSY